MKRYLFSLFCLLTCLQVSIAINKSEALQRTNSEYEYRAVIYGFSTGSDNFEVHLLNKPVGTDFTWHCDEGWEALVQDEEHALFFFTGIMECYDPTWVWLEYYDAEGVHQRIIWEFKDILEPKTPEE